MKNMKSGKAISAKGFRKSLLAMSIIASVPAYSFAAEEVDTAAAAEVEIEQITVSGSRLKTRPGYDAPTPTTILSSDLLEEMGNVNVADALNRLPSMGDGTSPRTSGNDVGTGVQGANFLNLRGLGTNRTLVLLDGKRVVSATSTGEVDINMLPTTLLKRTEIVTGGASAAWGSDAVAGVVNFILDKDYVGTKGSVQAGQSGYSDADELKADIATGFEFDEGRGHVIASLNYTSAKGVDRADSRDWFKGTKLVGNPDWPNDPTAPERLVVDNVGTFIGSDAGHTFLNAGPLAGRTFTPDGDVVPFDFGTRYPRGPLGTSVTGDGRLNDFSARTQILAEYETINSFIRGSYEISDDIEVYGEFMYGATEGESLSVPYYRFAGALRASIDNPFLPAELAAEMNDAGVTSVPMGRSNVDFGRANPYNDREMMRFLVGADVQIDDNWSMTTYYERGTLDVINETRSNANTSKYALAVDAVDDGNGNTVCRSTLSNPDNGCVAANIFGEGAPSQEAIDYVIGTARLDSELQQDVFAVTFNGDLFELPAGAITSAFGYEYRKEQFVAKADDISKESGWWVGNYKDAGGEYDVNEVFAELLVPVFYDTDFGESLDLSLAVRSTDYSTSGRVTTWKAGFSYDIGKGVSLRGTKSRDIRAPNLNEYYSGGQTNSIFFNDYVNLVPDANDPTKMVPSNYLVPRTIQGNTELTPEEADSTTIGIVYAPEFIDGLEFSLDYFNIETNDAIQTVPDNQLTERCAGVAPFTTPDQEFCELITRDSVTNQYTGILSLPKNLSLEVLTAYDFEISYNFEAAGGTVDLHALWTYTTEHYTLDGDIKDDLLGEYQGDGGPQEWAGLNSVKYTNEGLTLSLRHRYIGEGVIDAQWESGVDVDVNEVKAVNYIDFTASQEFELEGGKVEIFASIDNLFDKEPPRVGFNGGTALDDLGASNRRHDLIGRYFRLGARFEF